MAAMALMASSASADNSHPLQSAFSLQGNGPSGIGLDRSTGNVLVAVRQTSSLNIFNGEGAIPNGVNVSKITGFGWASEPSGVAIDNAVGSPSKGDLYVTDLGPAAVKKYHLNVASKEYELVGTLSSPSIAEPLGLTVDSKGNVFVSDWAAAAVIEFNPSGVQINEINVSGSVGRPSSVAVNSKGDLYVQGYNSPHPVFKYAANVLGEIKPSTVPTLLAEEEATGVAVDPNTDVVYVAFGNRIGQYSAAGVPEASFGFGAVTSTERLVVDSAGQIYVTDRGDEEPNTGRVVVFGALDIPSVTTGAATGVESESAVFNGVVGPDEVALTDCHFEFVTAAAFATGGFSDLSSGGTAACNPNFGAIPADNNPHAVTAAVSGLVPGTNYRVRLVAANANGINRGSNQPLKTLGPPTIFNEHTASAIFTEATVQALVNPEGLTSTYHVEYGTGTTYGSRTAEAAAGDDETNHPISVPLVGLTPGSLYHWRVVAVNAVGTTNGPDQTFVTSQTSLANEACVNQVFRTGASAELPDCRAYEMVSPIDKNNTDIVSLINIDSHPVRLDQSSLNGESLTYTTSQGFGDTKGTPYVSQYIASRGADGWSSRGVSPPQGVNPVEIGHRIDLEFRAFTPDLCSGVFVSSTEPLLAPGATQGFRNLYQRTNCGTESYKTLSTAVPGPGEVEGEYEPRIEGITAGGQCAVFTAYSALPEPLYESCSKPA